MSAPRTPKIPFGGDYNPEQWPEEVWDEDHRVHDSVGADIQPCASLVQVIDFERAVPFRAGVYVR
ncbi:hypothetical protein [Streptomyces sp. 4N124]|uniref:hypothetical protein n=1 Tax=Streptomyces sp. 4N124 TaxID=3457420 RepID=UPI003FD536E9